MKKVLCGVGLGLLLALTGPWARAQSDLDSVLFMLDHMAHDYPNVVVAGKVQDPSEYAEQQAFAQAVREGVEQLGAGGNVLAKAAALQQAIETRAPAPEVLGLITGLEETLDKGRATAQPPPPPSKADSPLAMASDLVDQAVAAYRKGDARGAHRLAGAAYLEGFEPVEHTVETVDPELKDRVEHSMWTLREAIRAGHPVDEVEAAAADVSNGLDEVRRRLSASATLASPLAFGAALIILLREGLEAILVVAAVAAFTLRSGAKPEAMRYVHVGWAGALLLGAATWAVAAYVTEISGAARELGEGTLALLSALMLFYVGFWLHDKAHSDRWRSYIQGKLEGAVGQRALWVLAAVAFTAVYREVFETILFYEALWVQVGPNGHEMVLAGLGTAAVGLVALAWLIVRLSMRVPLSLFFRINAVLLFALAVVFAGKGVAALQEAGRIPADAIALLPHFEPLGIYPNLETLAAQGILVVAALLIWFKSGRGPAS